MKKTEIAKIRDKGVRLRPAPREIDEAGKDLGEYDYTWFVTQATQEALLLHASDGRRRFRTRIPADHILEYRLDAERLGRGFLLLKSQVWIQGDQVHVEPVHPHPKIATRSPGPTPAYRIAASRGARRRRPT